MKFNFDAVEDLIGFATENKKEGNTIKILTRATLTSDDSEFYTYTEHISNIFLNKKQILIDGVYQFLIILHANLKAELYINNFPVLVEIKVKRDVKAGELLSQNDIADLRRVKFPNIEIKETDKIIYCFKVGWRFGLFFDLAPRSQPLGAPRPIVVEKLDIDKMELSIGELRRYLSFYHVYKVLESEAQFEEMMKEGWFPFVEILAGEYKKLSEVYQNKFDFENRIKIIVDGFTVERIKTITDRWWKNQIFNDKKNLIEAGVNAYLQNTKDGCVNCIKNLWTEIEGLLRTLYHVETGKGDGVKTNEIVSHIVNKAKAGSGSEYSLLLPMPFLEYLNKIVFANFNIETGNVDMSRHSSSHGVATTQQYTKERALQLILILDQIYYFAAS